MKRRNFLISTLIGTGSLSGIQNLYAKSEIPADLSEKKTVSAYRDLHRPSSRPDKGWRKKTTIVHHRNEPGKT
ncbi:hypothetical protein [Pedobacter ginsengisoli]|uniref:hypothetical protein n=1 Tax=Pedobacter ginsengisoli TaxID=363852 RepID=UPI001C12C3E0|nr:hypothetical protein [Pedobacter ginsengisoli]